MYWGSGYKLGIWFQQYTRVLEESAQRGSPCPCHVGGAVGGGRRPREIVCFAKGSLSGLEIKSAGSGLRRSNSGPMCAPRHPMSPEAKGESWCEEAEARHCRRPVRLSCPVRPGSSSSLATSPGSVSPWSSRLLRIRFIQLIGHEWRRVLYLVSALNSNPRHELELGGPHPGCPRSRSWSAPGPRLQWPV